MAWSDAARQAAALMRQRRASGKTWRTPQRAKLLRLRAEALAAKLEVDHHPMRHVGLGREYGKAVTRNINAMRKLIAFKKGGG